MVYEAFGPERLMYGSDWPVCNLAASYIQVHDLVADFLEQFDAEVQEKVWATNAVNFYHLNLSA